MDFVIQGLKSGMIAERLNLTLPYVSTIINAPQFQHQLAIRREKIENEIDSGVISHKQEAVNASIEAERVLRAHAKQTAENLVRLVDGDKEPISLRASQDLLDRVGPQKRTGVDVASTVVNIDMEAAILIKETIEMDKGENQ